MQLYYMILYDILSHDIVLYNILLYHITLYHIVVIQCCYFHVVKFVSNVPEFIPVYWRITFKCFFLLNTTFAKKEPHTSDLRYTNLKQI